MIEGLLVMGLLVMIVDAILIEDLHAEMIDVWTIEEVVTRDGTVTSSLTHHLYTLPGVRICHQ